MHRDFLLNLLRDYHDIHPEEQEVNSRITTFIQQYSNCFDRSLSVGHITGSAWLVNQEGTHVLLTHHKKLNAWFQLGGHSDGESNTLKVALTEAIEESGLSDITSVVEKPTIFDIDIHAIPARKSDPEHLHYDVRFALKASSNEYVVSEESHDLAWVEIARLSDYTTEESMSRMARKWQQGVRFL